MAFRAERLALGLCFVVACSDDQPQDTENNTTNPSGVSLDPTVNPTQVTSSTTVDETTEPTGGTVSGTTTATTGPGTTSSTTADETTTTGSDSTTGVNCVGLECQIDDCGGDPKQTKIRGTVFAPEGTLPLYNITVYVPSVTPLPPIADGVTCDTCGGALPGDPIVAALTDTKGEFVLEGVPSGDNIPLVISVGKWRREVVLPTVVACSENVAPFDLTRLPRNQREGHIPRIALTTGGADPLECLLRKIGIEDSEFTNPDGPGRVNFYAGFEGPSKFSPELNGGATYPKAEPFWNELDSLKLYDIVLMACEGSQDEDNKSDQARQNILEYAGLGGRLFMSHWHNVWIQKGPNPWPDAADFDFQSDLNEITAKIDTSFPKGQALADWMVNVQGSQVPGEIELVEAQHTIDSVDPDLATRWVYTDDPVSVQYFTFNAPMDAAPEQQCGRVVDSDIHVSSGDDTKKPFPVGCETEDLSPQEKALVFMLFELSACLIPDDEDPIPG